MKNYELKPCEVALVVEALRYVKLYAYGDELRDGEIEEYYALCELLQKLGPKPVQKNAWMVVYDDESRSRLFDWESEAREWASHTKAPTKVVRVTWEE